MASKRRRSKLTEMLPAEVIHDNPPTLPNDYGGGGNKTLAEIRASVTQHRTETAHVIADLEAWRTEIDSTIAFLKERR